MTILPHLKQKKEEIQHPLAGKKRKAQRIGNKKRDIIPYQPFFYKATTVPPARKTKCMK